ncbi:MAG: hypothetical protein Q9201_004696 [Fulgogasparrea decipioides]
MDRSQMETLARYLNVDLNSLYENSNPSRLASVNNSNVPNVGMEHQLFQPIMYAPPVNAPAPLSQLPQSSNQAVVQGSAQQDSIAPTRRRGRDYQAADHDNGQTRQPATPIKERAPDRRLVLRDPNDPSKGRRLRTVEEQLELNDYTSDEKAARGRDSSMLKYMRFIPQHLSIAEQWKEYDRRELEKGRPGRRPKERAPEESEERPRKRRATPRTRPVNEVNPGLPSPPITPPRMSATGGNGNVITQMGLHEQQVLPPPPSSNYAPNGDVIAQVPSYQQPTLLAPPLSDETDIWLAPLDEYKMEKNAWNVAQIISQGFIYDTELTKRSLTNATLLDLGPDGVKILLTP